MYDEDHLRTRLGQQISEAMRQLLSEKNLYQSAEIDHQFLDDAASAEHQSQRNAAAAPRLPGSSGPKVHTVAQIRQQFEKFLKVALVP